MFVFGLIEFSIEGVCAYSPCEMRQESHSHVTDSLHRSTDLHSSLEDRT